MGDTSKYYNFDKIGKTGKLFNFIITPRSAGKTIAMKKRAIDKSMKEDKRFVYVRRRGTEITSGKMDGFFTKMQKFYWQSQNFEYQTGKFYWRERDEEGKILNEKLLGYAVALSTGINERSVDFVDVTDIYFEEFCLTPDSHHNYLEDEVFKFLELYSTIAREDEVQVWFLGNKLQEYNPYFLYFDIIPPKSGIKVWKDFSVEIWQELKFIEEKSNTRFGRLVANTPYYDYAVQNIGFENNESFCRNLPKKSQPVSNILYNQKWYTLYVCQDGSMQIVEHNQESKVKICMDVKDMTPDIVSFKSYKSTLAGKTLRKCLETNKMFYQSPKSEEVYRVIAKGLYF